MIYIDHFLVDQRKMTHGIKASQLINNLIRRKLNLIVEQAQLPKQLIETVRRNSQIPRDHGSIKSEHWTFGQFNLSTSKQNTNISRLKEK